MLKFIYFLSSSICWPRWLGCASDWWSGGCGFNPCWVANILLWRFDHEIFSTVILSLPLIHEGQLSVSGERMCTLLVNCLEDLACPINVWLGKLATLDMTPLGWLGHETSKQTQTKSSSIHADKVYTRVLQKFCHWAPILQCYVLSNIFLAHLSRRLKVSYGDLSPFGGAVVVDRMSVRPQSLSNISS